MLILSQGAVLLEVSTTPPNLNFIILILKKK